jgi:hypothetical protein
MTPVASAAARVPGPPWELSRETGPLPAVPAATDQGPPTDPEADGDYKGLPRRVKQASLAPQLRADPSNGRTARGGTAAAGGSGGPTPAEIRRTMSALQRGWEEGRSPQEAGPSGPGPADTGEADPAAPDVTAPGSATD